MFDSHTWRVKLSPTDLFSKCEQICNFLRIESYLLKEALEGRFRMLRAVRYYSRRCFGLSRQWEQLNNHRSCCCSGVFIFTSEQICLVSHINFMFHLSEAVTQTCSVRKDVLETCARVSFLIKLQAWGFIKEETLEQVFSCEFREIYKNTFLYKTPPVAAC